MILALVFFILILGGVASALFAPNPVQVNVRSMPTPPPVVIVPETQETGVSRDVTLRGEIVCLPHRNTEGPQTMECAFGLKTANGFYALSSQQNVIPPETGKSVEVKGVMVPAQAINSDQWQKYNIVGVVEVKSYKLL